MVIFALALLAFLILQRTAFGRKVYFIGANRAVAEYSGLDVRAVKAWIFIASGTISALAGLLFAARVGAVRGDVWQAGSNLTSSPWCFWAGSASSAAPARCRARSLRS
jgi:ribose/xylose/arabinose/galactoside ABC-type transport system permease subunit